MARAPSTVWQSLDFIIEKGGMFVSLVVLMGLTPACFDSSSKISNAVFGTKSSGEPVVEATKNALKMIGYQVGQKDDPREASEGSRAIHGEKVGGMVTAFGPATVHILKSISSRPEEPMALLRSYYTITSMLCLSSFLI